MKIGFIGLGIMGKPMARNLLAAGHELVVHNRSRTAVDELAAEGATPAATPAEVAQQAVCIYRSWSLGGGCRTSRRRLTHQCVATWRGRGAGGAIGVGMGMGATEEGKA